MLTKLQKLVNSKIREYNNNKFSGLLLSTKISDSTLWKLTNRYKRSETDIPPIHIGNKPLYKTKDKVNAFANYYQSVHSQNVNLGSKNHDRLVRSTVNKFLKANNGKKQTVDHFVTPKEVIKYIKKLKNKKSPGFDQISSLFIKRLPIKAIVMLTKIINSMLSIGYFPNAWKLSKIIPTYKKVKDSKLVSSYRPISLLSH